MKKKQTLGMKRKVGIEDWYESIKWIDYKSRKPRGGGEEKLIVHNLHDGCYPVVQGAYWSKRKKAFFHGRTDEEGGQIAHSSVLFWANHPRPPKGIPRSVYKYQPVEPVVYELVELMKNENQTP